MSTPRNPIDSLTEQAKLPTFARFKRESTWASVLNEAFDEREAL